MTEFIFREDSYVRSLPTLVTAMPEADTGLLNASTSWIRGCWANTTPLTASADGWATIVSLPADPLVAVALKVTGARSGAVAMVA